MNYFDCHTGVDFFLQGCVGKEKEKEGGRGVGLEEELRLAHGALEVERLDVLPVLLEQRHQEVDRLDSRHPWTVMVTEGQPVSSRCNLVFARKASL